MSFWKKLFGGSPAPTAQPPQPKSTTLKPPIPAPTARPPTAVKQYSDVHEAPAEKAAVERTAAALVATQKASAVGATTRAATPDVSAVGETKAQTPPVAMGGHATVSPQIRALFTHLSAEIDRARDAEYDTERLAAIYAYHMIEYLHEAYFFVRERHRGPIFLYKLRDYPNNSFLLVIPVNNRGQHDSVDQLISALGKERSLWCSESTKSSLDALELRSSIPAWHREVDPLPLPEGMAEK